MASRTAAQAMRLVTSARPAFRNFQTSARKLQDVSPLPARKPMGAFRSGLVAPKAEDPLSQRWRKVSFSPWTFVTAADNGACEKDWV